MRPISIVISIVVLIALYFFVFERENVRALSNAVDAPPSEEMMETEEAPMDEMDADDREEGVHVVVTRSTAQVLQSAVLLRGDTEAARMVNVTAETQGRVVSEPLRKGSYVEEGDVLCQLDMGTRAANLAQAKSRLAEAQVASDNATRLAEGGYTSETQLLSEQAGLEGARASVAQIERDIENIEIRAPFAGLLETDTAELGTFLSPGAPCSSLIQLDPIKLVVFAPEIEVNRIEVGAMAGGRLVSGDEVAGRVTFLARSADPQTRTFRVEVAIPNPDFAIRAGQTVEVAVASAGEDAHLVKQSALTLNSNGDLGVRVIDEDHIVGFAPVNIIRDATDGVWVSGLPDTVEIITVGQEYVSPGVKVVPSYSE